MWKSSCQTVTAMSTTESEIVAQSDLLTISEEVHSVSDFLRGLTGGESLQLGQEERRPLLGGNRSAILIPEKTCIEDVPTKSRHIALRCRSVMNSGLRSIFCPTDAQLADGLTKAPTANMVKNLLFPASMSPKGVDACCVSEAVPFHRFSDQQSHPNFGWAWRPIEGGNVDRKWGFIV